MEHLNQIVDYTNDVIVNTGKKIQNRVTSGIWKRLGRWSNYDWAIALDYMNELYETRPELFDYNHLIAVREATRTLLDEHEVFPKGVFKDSANRSVAWHAVMTMREVCNARDGIDIPNENTVKQKLTDIVSRT